MTSLFAQIPPRNRPGYCPLRPSSPCVDFVIERVSRWDVDDEYELLSLENACAGVIGDECMKFSETVLPWYELNNIDDLKNIARACKLTSPKCLEYMVPQLSRWDYNNLTSFREVAMSCARVTDIKCITRRCDLRSYRCSRSEDLIRAAKQCYEPCYE